jgi:hypothetical protein
MFFVDNSALNTDNGDSSMSLFIATILASLASFLYLTSSNCCCNLFLSASNPILSSLNLFFVDTISSSFTVNYLPTSYILCFNSSSNYTILSSLLCNSTAFPLILLSSYPTLFIPSIN